MRPSNTWARGSAVYMCVTRGWLDGICVGVGDGALGGKLTATRSSEYSVLGTQSGIRAPRRPRKSLYLNSTRPYLVLGLNTGYGRPRVRSRSVGAFWGAVCQSAYDVP